ncbi:hypothetical protein WISP_122020 [Willisornis vidua]|uniref:Uncharacterized protein n=1 Tax=Willisornis vidua TaxID=1566151 RepID=A0ABQ9CXS8_9PASS|nr:hypothetical protein WISP_122020 [Willisornis vidua]
MNQTAGVSNHVRCSSGKGSKVNGHLDFTFLLQDLQLCSVVVCKGETTVFGILDLGTVSKEVSHEQDLVSF